MRVRVAAFVALVVICIAVGTAVLLYARSDNPTAGPPTEATLPAGQAALDDVMAQPHVAFRNTSLGANYGKVEVVPLNDVSGPRAVTSLSCDRVAIARGAGLCLVSHQGIPTTYEAQGFDASFHITYHFALPGLPSRARLSPDGHYAAMTVFVRGDSYAGTNFSTRTMFVDTTTGRRLGNLEQFAVTDNGKPVRAQSRNYWGVTFADDSNTFYATLAIGDDIHLIKGDLALRTAHTIANGVECPSLSPDQTHIAYKLRVSGQFSALGWRLHVLDLRTGRDVALAETRSVDDQVEWLNDHTVLYSLPHARAGSAQQDTWELPSDGSGAPKLFLSGSWSPAVTR
jgi:hypothetical protein